MSSSTILKPHARVVLLVETARVFGREFLCGVARYSHEHGPWSFHVGPGDFDQVVPRMQDWGATGIIARIPNEKAAQEILAAGLPTIALGLTDSQLAEGSPLHSLPEVSSDPYEVARLAADHLLERHYRNLAYVGRSDRGWSARREKAFAKYLGELKIEPAIYPAPSKKSEAGWEREQSILAKWIRELPKPVGIFACNDDRGREVLEACTLAGCRVPDDAAVVGVDNDIVFCELADPPLSSVSLNSETAGYRAAELLDGMMAGREVRARSIAVEALGVVTRRSSEIIAVEDEDVSAALKIIHQNYGKDVSVESLVEELAVSRRSLEKRFRECLGRSILDEVQVARLNHSKRLLLETPHSISQIAKLAGFGTVGYFIQFFRQRVGKTPGKFREDLTH